MKKTVRIIIAGILLIAELLRGVGVVQANEVEAEGITLEHIQIPSTQQDTKSYYTGEIMQSVLKLKANLSIQEYAGAYISIEIPADVSGYVDSIVPNIDYRISEVFSRYERTSATEGRIYLKDSDDAREAEIPVFTKFKAWETPNGTRLPITVSLKKKDGTVVKTAEDTVEFIGVAGGAAYSHSVVGGHNQYGGISTDRQTLDKTGLVDVVFEYKTDFNVRYRRDVYGIFANDTGKRLYEKIVLTQPLPEYAVFDASKNQGWELRGTNLIYTLDRKDYDQNTDGYKSIFLRLTFPGAWLNTTYQTTSTMEFYPKNKPDYEDTSMVSQTVHYRFSHENRTGNPFVKSFKYIFGEDNTSGFSEAKVANIATRLAKGLDWEIGVGNTYSEPLTFVEFKDYDLDSRLYYTGVSLVDLSTPLSGTNKSVTGLSVKAIMKDGTEKVMGTVSTGRTLRFTNTEEAKKIQSLYFVFPNGFVLNTNERITIKILTAFREAATVSADEAQNRYYNSGSYIGTHVKADGSIYQVNGEDHTFFRLVEPKADIGIGKTLDERLGTGWFAGRREEPLRADGELAIWEIGQVWGYDAVQGAKATDKITDLEIIDLLPEGLDYKEAETLRESRNALSYGKGGKITYHENYQDSGLNAVVISYDSITVRQFNQLIDYGYIKIVTSVNSNSLPGQNNNIILMKVAGDFLLQSEGNHMGSKLGIFNFRGYQDVRDLDQDGDISEYFAASGAYYEYTGRYELIARKYIARADRENYNRVGLYTGLGAEFRYKLFNYNNKFTDITSYELIDFFPYVNDYTLARDAAKNEFLERNSQFSNTLRGPVTILGGNKNKFTIEYTTDSLANKAEAPGTSLTWQAQVADYTQVTGIRVRLKEKQVFKRNEVLEIEVPMKAPEVGKLNQKAWNDFVISSDGNDYVPTNQVYNEIYVPSGILEIIKENVKGERLSGGVFEVTNKDDSNQKYTLTTQEDGIIQQVLPIGTYTVEEIKAPTGYVRSDEIYEVVIEESDIQELKATSVTVVNTPLGTLNVYKVDHEDPSIVLANATFELKNSKGEMIGTKTTNEEGKVVFEGLSYDTYQLVETKAPAKYRQNDKPIEIVVDKDHTSIHKTIENVKERGSIKLIKSEAMSEGLNSTLSNQPKLLAGARFELRTLSGDVIETKTTDTNGEIVFENLLYDTYELAETKAPDGYLLLTSPMKVTLGTSEYVVHVSNNKIETMNYVVTKEWIGIESDKAPEVKVYLYKNGEKTNQSVTLNKDNQWTAKFENLPVAEKLTDEKAIEYTVKEDGEKNGKVIISGNEYHVVYEGKDNTYNITNIKSNKPGDPIPNTQETPKPNTPSNPTTPGNPTTPDKSLPKTGDGTNPTTYAVLASLAGGILVLLGLREYNMKRKKNGR